MTKPTVFLASWANFDETEAEWDDPERGAYGVELEASPQVGAISLTGDEAWVKSVVQETLDEWADAYALEEQGLVISARDPGWSEVGKPGTFRVRKVEVYVEDELFGYVVLQGRAV